MGMADAYLIPAVDGCAYGLLLFVVAAGLTVALGAGDVLNLAHGLLYTLGAYCAAVLGDGTWIGLGVAAVAGTAAGAAGGALVAAALTPLAGRGHLAQALLTFGMSLTGTAGLVALFGAQDLRPVVPAALDTSVLLAGHRYPAYRLVFIAVAALLVTTGWLLLSRTRAGAKIRAMVDDRHMLACLGIRPGAVLAGVLTAAGALAGLTGVLGAPIIGAGPRTAETVLLMSLVIVVVGRLGSITGAFTAAIGVGQVQSVGVALIPDWAPYLLFATMAVTLIARPVAGPAGARR